MSVAAGPLGALRRTPVVVAVVIAVVVVIVWLLAFFLPQGSKISTLDTKQQTLEQQVAQGNAKVARLKHTFQHAPQLRAMSAKLEADVPATTDIYNYIDSLSTTAAASNVKLTSVSPGAATQTSTGSPFTAIPVSMVVKGTYDHLLSLITNIYALPRLTDIDSVSISGGGPGTSRTTTLIATLSLEAFTTAKPPAPAP
jgi:Tfp pilus assembly protein PilO